MKSLFPPKRFIAIFMQATSLFKPIDLPKWSVSENALRQRQRPTEETRNLYWRTSWRGQSSHGFLDIGRLTWYSVRKPKNGGGCVDLGRRQTPCISCQINRPKTINQAVKKLQEDYPIYSITADNGSEFSQLSELPKVEVYYAHAYSSHEEEVTRTLMAY